MSGLSKGVQAVATATGLVAVGIVIGAGVAPRAGLPKALALTALADDSFSVCTVPIGPGIEALFMLDFETGDLSGGVLNPSTSRFSGSYKHNVLKDLGFKAGQAKNPRFLLVSGVADLQAGGNNQYAQSVLYVTDSSTGTTVAYGIPWNPQQNGAAPFAAELVPLDVARPRGGGAKAAGPGAKAK
jgi:hypothetical protein